MICIGHSTTHQISIAKWWVETALLSFDYVNNRYMVGGNNVSLTSTHDVTRTSDGYFNNIAGVWPLFVPNIARRTNRGFLTEPSDTNKNENYNANPTDLTGLTIGGAGVLSIVDDAAEIHSAGLHNICTSGKVIKAENSGGSNAFLVFAGGTANTNEHTLSIYARGDAPHIASLGIADNFGEEITLTTEFNRFELTGTPSAPNYMYIRVNVGETVYCILNQLEEGAEASTPIVVSGAPATRASDQIRADQIATTLAGMTRGIIKVHFYFENVFSGGSYPRFLSITNDTGTEAVQITSDLNAGLAFILRSNGNAHCINPSPNIMLEGYNIIVLGVFENGDVRVSLNGSPVTGSSSTPIPVFSSFVAAYVGASRTGDVDFASIVREIIILDEDPTNTRIEELSIL
ncbi:MAG: hypothetical protein COA69_00820 [Robiginitomaculum sp.]|nr:MAG: hypothetical protein COA69_00820 [Robiginitomaculum sp.]